MAHEGSYDYEHVNPTSPYGTPFDGTPAMSRRPSYEYQPSPAASTTRLVGGRPDSQTAGGLQRLRPTLDKNHSTYFNGSSTNLATENDYMIPERDSYEDDKSPYNVDEEDASTVTGSTPETKSGFDNRFSTTSSFGREYTDADYVVREIAKHDDIALMKPWKRKLHYMAPLFTIAAMGGYFTYYAFRIYYTVDAQRTNHKTYGMAWFFIAAEFLVARKFHHSKTISFQFLQKFSSLVLPPNVLHARIQGPQATSTQTCWRGSSHR
jgi:hypothetical protein